MRGFDESFDKIVTRRKAGGDSLSDAAILLDTIAKLRGPMTPKGVWKFKTFEEADEWALSRMARNPVPRA